MGQPVESGAWRAPDAPARLSHYVTDALDEGPIIEQDVIRVSHRDQVEDPIQKGRDLERMVLPRAVRWHLARLILCHGNKPVVFD